MQCTASQIIMTLDKLLRQSYADQRNLYINRHLQDGVGMEFTAC